MISVGKIEARVLMAKKEFYLHHHADRVLCFDCSALDGTPHDWTDEDWRTHVMAEQVLENK